MLQRTEAATYDSLRDGFRWLLPDRLNMGSACADRHPPGDLALVDLREDAPRTLTFADLTTASSRLANGLASLGVGAGDRIGVLLPQSAEAGISHLAAWKLGAVSMPLTQLFGPDALAYRLGDSGARALITDRSMLEVVADVTSELGDLELVVVGDQVRRPHHGFETLVREGSPDLAVADTGPDDPALLIYTSGTTGNPKGALHGHRVVLGHLPGFELMFEFFPQPGDVTWTPADWAWIGGLMDALIPSWFHGRPVVATARRRFDPDWAVEVMRGHRVTAAFLPPTALKMMRTGDVHAPDLPLRAIMSGGEPLGAEMLAWAEEHLGVTVNEIYGQTEANILVGNCASVWPIRPGSMGRPYPGHDVAIMTGDGALAAPGEVGEIVVRSPDPVMMLRYWNQPDATEHKYRDGWLRTGDLGHADDEGYLWFTARDDDVINSAGYRIGPAEIEGCLMAHPAVAMCAAVGVPDDLRGQVVKAYVVTRDGFEPGDDLAREIQDHVRQRLAAYEYPREIEFLDELPMTTTGKILRRELRHRPPT